MLGKKFLKKFIMLFAMCLAFVMLTNFSSSGLRFNNAEKTVTVYALDDDGADPDTEDNRYEKLLPLVLSEYESELKTSDNGDITFKGTCDIFENMQDVYIEEFTVSCSFRQIDDEDMWFTVEQDSPYYDNITETKALVSEEDGSLYVPIYVEGQTLYTSWYRDDSRFGDLLQGIVDGDLTNVFGFEDMQHSTSGTVTQSATVDENIGVLNQDYNASPHSVSGWGLFAFIVAVVIVTYVIVCQTAEQIKAESNKRHNASLDDTTAGLETGTYILDQNNPILEDYKFGFAKFPKVGCAVAAAYNLMITLDNPQPLSEVIYDFEKLAIEFAFAWGNFGSNPHQIYHYLKKYNIRYRKYSSWNNYNNAVASTESTNFIIGKWNGSIANGGHTFYFNRADDNYNAYNYDRSGEIISSSNLLTFVDNKKSNFIVGYIIFE